MAALDDLLARIQDESLRTALEREIAPLRNERELGMVFERHLPEKVRLQGVPVRRGSIVELRAEQPAPTWRVIKVTNGKAELRRRSDGGSTILETHQVEDLVVVREFGQPIYPGLKSVGRIERGGDKPFHTVINAENYHALEMLLYTCEGQVDAIYIDPPYNTGAKDWKYNNDYVDGNDGYRHSKWLSFMERRLELARRLINPEDSVLVVTIDEHEVSRLGVLLGQLFLGADITLVTIVINPKGVTRPGVRRFSRVEEYAFFCFFGKAGLGAWGDDLLTLGADSLEREAAADGEKRRPRWKGLLRSGTNARRVDRKNMFYPVLIDAQRGAVLGAGEPLDLEEQPDFDTKIDGLTPVWPVRSDGSLGNWGVGHTTLREMIDKGYVSVGGYDERRRTWALSYLSKEPQEQLAAGILTVDSFDQERNVIDAVYADPESAGRRIKTVWHRTAHDAGAGGTDVISGLLGGRHFTFPKSVYAVRDTLAMLTQHKKDALVLDFFGGSGTTAHATMMLNAEDNGTRRCILVTNNEVEEEAQAELTANDVMPGAPDWESRGIFYRATKPRLEAAVSGKKADGSTVPSTLRNANGTAMADGYEENIEFFTLTYEDADRVRLGAAFAAIAPMLWLMAGAVGPRIDKVADSWALPDGARYGVLFDADQFTGFVEAVKTAEGVTHAFVVTDSDSVFQRVVAELPDTVTPVRLYESYLRSFTINTGVSA